MFVVFQSIGDRKVMTPAAAMSSAANVVRSLIFVAIFKILNVKKMLKNVKFFTHYFSAPPWLFSPPQRWGLMGYAKGAMNLIKINMPEPLLLL